MSSFTALGVSAELAQALTQRSITEPFAIQTAALPDALAGLDILGESPTGSGKTLAFGLPLIERTAGTTRKPGALVLAPTRELATQIADDLAPFAAVKRLRVAAVYGGVSLKGQVDRARTANIIVATPGRLNDLLEQRLIDLRAVRVLVLDEADRMLDMGFKPQVDRIVNHLPENRQTMLFSATLAGPVEALANAYTVNPVRVRAELPAEKAYGQITHTFVGVSAENKVDRLVEQLKAIDGLAIVFVRTKHGADKLARRLGKHAIDAVALHGNLNQNQRQRALARFASGRVGTLVATDVAARGLDVDDISHVINFDPPTVDADYVHRIGRTGRAGRSGTGVTFVLPEQQNDVGRLAGRLGQGRQFSAAGLVVPKPPVAQRPKSQRRRAPRARR
jgi:superfamily II DNA/RNA helicase